MYGKGRQAQFTWSRLLLCPLLSLWESFPLERARKPPRNTEPAHSLSVCYLLDFDLLFPTVHALAKGPWWLLPALLVTKQ
ncbi:hypothetical protein NQZ68_004477 [Dissostichus eleginoides]|nr:hypothetical protein NQZ68_004477 [Dissostichus eleginoides]